MAEIVLTADRTNMSDHHNSEFLGFGTCIPPYLLTTGIYKKIFFPPVKAVDGIPRMAPYSLRKVEAKLLDLGFDAKVVDPDHLKKHLEGTRIIGISVMDPFGWGPASSTFETVLKKGDVFASKFFKELLQKEEIKEAKKNGAKLIVGGPGTWQFEYKRDFVEDNGIDCVFMGEAEKDLKCVFERALNGEDLPRFFDAYKSPAPTLEEISDIKHASINGLVEVGRGCPRGCPFCSVTLRRLRWYPYEKIERELEVNNREGVDFGIIHAEDVLLYGVHGVKPDVEKLEKLFDLFAKHYKRVSWSHASIAAIASEPKAIEAANEILLRRQDWFGVEIGIETGSPSLIERAMPAKAKPFDPKNWQEIVYKALSSLHDNSIVPACTLIIGLPGEREEDIIKTIELMDIIKDCRSMIVPLFFVPMGRLKNEDWFGADELSDIQIELLKKCLTHSIRWSKKAARGYNKGHFYSPLLNTTLVGFIGLIEGIAKKRKLLIKSPPPGPGYFKTKSV
jgi:radical SAM superfamily enzyme YgiQ (UPF0313 family)